MFKFGNGIAANSTVDLAELLIVMGLGVGESAKKTKRYTTLPGGV